MTWWDNMLIYQTYNFPNWYICEIGCWLFCWWPILRLTLLILLTNTGAINKKGPCLIPELTVLKTHWGRDKIDAISQTTFSSAFSWMKNVWISINISLKFVPKGPINHIPALCQIMAWRRPGDKPLSEPMMISLPTHIRSMSYCHHKFPACSLLSPHQAIGLCSSLNVVLYRYS